MSDDLDPWDKAILEAMATGNDLVTLEQLSERTGISTSILEALAREGLLIPRTRQPEERYDLADSEALQAGFELLGAGLPLAELLELAREMNEAMRPIAARAVTVFERFVRDSVEASAGSEAEATQRLTEAFEKMLPATGRLVDRHFRRLLIAHAENRLKER
jgi:DNA-binding transcriptional MerR regulator